MNIGIIGFGGVGKALIELIVEKKKFFKNKYNLDLIVKYIIKSDGGIYNESGINLEEILSFIKGSNKIQEYKYWKGKEVDIDYIIKNNDVDTIVELTSTNIVNGEPGLTHINKALKNNINVVTGNKGPILLNYKDLDSLAKNNNVKLMVGCTTGGALPSITGGMYDVAGADILSIEGILNGTTNFILSEMENKEIDYHEALKIAQDLGIAEANPKLDVGGFDTAAKILILSNVLMGTELTLKDINIEGITKVNTQYIKDLKANNKKIKLIGKIAKEDDNIIGYVKTVEIDSEHPLYSVDGKNKGVYFKTDTLGDISLIGGASGTINAAASILRDIILISSL